MLRHALQRPKYTWQRLRHALQRPRTLQSMSRSAKDVAKHA